MHVLVQSEGREVQIGLDLRAQEATGVSERRCTESGMDFLRDASAADHGSAFEDQHLEAGLREVRGRDETVVTSADDDRVR